MAYTFHSHAVAVVDDAVLALTLALSLFCFPFDTVKHMVVLQVDDIVVMVWQLVRSSQIHPYHPTVLMLISLR